MFLWWTAQCAHVCVCWTKYLAVCSVHVDGECVRAEQCVCVCVCVMRTEQCVCGLKIVVWLVWIDQCVVCERVYVCVCLTACVYGLYTVLAHVCGVWKKGMNLIKC